MKLVVFSDNHGNLQPLIKIVQMHKDAYAFIHLGDSQHTIEQLKQQFPYIHIIGVRGNCDIDNTLPREETLLYGGKKIFCCHGHLHGVKSGIGTLQKMAQENGYDIVLFGHTHVRYQNYVDGVHFFNPGSCARPRDHFGPSFGLIEIRDNGILISYGQL